MNAESRVTSYLSTCCLGCGLGTLTVSAMSGNYVVPTVLVVLAFYFRLTAIYYAMWK